MGLFTSKEEKEMGPELWKEFKKERGRIPTLGPRSGKDKKNLQDLFLSVARGDRVIVRRYFQWVAHSKVAMKQFEHEANILARHGYTAGALNFSPNGILTGGLAGQGEHMVTFTKVM